MRRLTLCLLVLMACHKTQEQTPSAPATAAPSPSATVAQAPSTFRARFDTTQGAFVVEAHRDWAPVGVDRFYDLVSRGYFHDIAFFRVIDGFMAQFGVHGEPKVSAQWRGATIPDDPPTGHSNQRGMLTFAKGGPNSRTTQMFINLADNPRLDQMGFPPVGQVVEGMEVVEKIYKVGEGKPAGPGPAQPRVQMEGNAFLKAEYPQLDYIRSATLQ